MSRIRLKKDPYASEAICAVNLLKLLLQKTGVIALGRRIMYTEPFFANAPFHNEWLEQIERILYYPSRFTKSKKYLYSEFDLSDAYPMIVPSSIREHFLINDLDFAEAFIDHQWPPQYRYVCRNTQSSLPRRSHVWSVPQAP